MKRSEHQKSFRFFAGVEIFAGVLLTLVLAATGGTLTVAILDRQMMSEEERAMTTFTEVVFERVRDTGDKITNVFAPQEDAVVLGEAREDSRVTMTFAGDMLFDPNYAIDVTIRERGGEISSVIDETLLTAMREADAAVINNEFPYATGGTPTAGKTFTFRAPPERSYYLREMGVDMVTLANNHTYDYGETGLIQTLEALENAGVAYTGAGRDIAAASAAWHFEKGDTKIAVIAATDIEETEPPDTKGATEGSPGVFRTVDDTLLLERIRQEKEAGYFVIVCMHWGRELESAINWLQERQAPEIAAAGADLIVGAHPHILQQISYIDGVPVVYSLGNFLFNSRTLDSAILKAEINENRLETLTFVPAIQSGCTVRVASEGERARIISYMNELSGSAFIEEDGRVVER